ncbi:MAG: RdgB/HAM1 family non-canonical purine NTP pyrophosphatase [Polyangiaceae bacterium]|nr:RdgB/HAM1 family non-canonical purine NTP pyrophosphatase [Polyangiaceae bacterium]
MPSARISLVVATGNRGKLAEIRAILRDLPVDVLSAEEALGEVPHVVEDAETFEANALKKARAIAAEALMVTIADDSGLEVDALGGRPGVRSARYAKEGATDAENNAQLMSALEDVDDPNRTARFRCAIALVDPWDVDGERVATGVCEGAIAHRPSGSGGFGYDPLFIVAGDGRTMAELGEEEKNRASHRGRALQALRPHLERLVHARFAEAARILGDAPLATPSRPGEEPQDGP